MTGPAFFLSQGSVNKHMACGLGEPTAEDCAIAHWCKALRNLGAHREPNGQWRAGCPVPGCKAKRALEWHAPGKHVQWNSFCGRHDKEAMHPYLATLLGPCLSGRTRRAPIRHADLEALALSGLPPVALKVQMLVYAGLTSAEAMDKLNIERATRYRVRRQLWQFGHNAAGQ